MGLVGLLIGVGTFLNITVIIIGATVFIMNCFHFWPGDDLFTYILVSSSWLMCWGSLSASLDVLALLGLHKAKRFLLLPWLIWTLVESVSLCSVVVLIIVYTNSLIFLPLILKIILSLIPWLQVRNVYKNSFGSFSTKYTNDIIFWMA